MQPNKIIPCIWLTADGGKLSTVFDYYKKVFEKDFQAGTITLLGQTPSGHTEMCHVTIREQTLAFMCTEQEHHQLNDAVSLMVNCDGQQEIDHFWNYFTKEGKAAQCGWCVDKYGLRWQIIPQNLRELMSQPNAYEVMMKQKKIVIEDYLK